MKRQRVSDCYRYNPHGYCIQDVIGTFKKVTTLKISAHAKGVHKLLTGGGVFPLCQRRIGRHMRVKRNIRSDGYIHPVAALCRCRRLWHPKLGFPLVFAKLLVIAYLRPRRSSPYCVPTRQPSVLTLACQSGSVSPCVVALSPNSLIIIGAVPS